MGIMLVNTPQCLPDLLHLHLYCLYVSEKQAFSTCFACMFAGNGQLLVVLPLYARISRIVRQKWPVFGWKAPFLASICPIAAIIRHF